MLTYLPAGPPQNELFNSLTHFLDLLAALKTAKAAGEPCVRLRHAVRDAGVDLAESLASLTEGRKTRPPAA
jgi:hypothetical protein